MTVSRPPRELGSFRDRKWRESLVREIAAGGTGTDVTAAPVVTVAASGDFTSERVLTGSSSILFTDNGAGSSIVATVIPSGIDVDDILPDQTGNAGKVLETNGTTASWETPSGVAGQATLDFGTGGTSVSATVADAGVSASSNFSLGIRVASGRDWDELELSPLQAVVSAVTAGVSFVVQLFTIHPDDFADGQFIIDYVRD